MPTVALVNTGQSIVVNASRAELNLVIGAEALLEFDAGGVLSSISLTQQNPSRVVKNDTAFTVTLGAGFGQRRVNVTW